MQTFINEEALEPEIQVWAVPLFRKNELWAFFEIPALALDRYADRSIGIGTFSHPMPVKFVETSVTERIPGDPPKKRKRKAKPKEAACDKPKAACASRSNSEMPKVPARSRKKKGGAG